MTARLTRLLAASAALVGAVLGVVLFLATGCGSTGHPGPEGAGAIDPVPWNQADVCSLLTDHEVAGFLGGAVPEPKASNIAGRPACEWRPYEAKRMVRLTIYQLPQLGPDLFEARNVPVRDVAGRPAYVTRSSPTGCTLQIAGGPAFITFEVEMPRPPTPTATEPPPEAGAAHDADAGEEDTDDDTDGEAEDPRDIVCDAVVESGQGVLLRLGW